MNIKTLKASAKESTKFRGHSLSRFTSFNMGERHLASAHCLLCDMSVMINNKPLPNEIEIGGEAVALNCTYRR